MKSDSCLMAFEELVQTFISRGVTNWPCVLVPQPDNRRLVSEQELKENLKHTWWEVAWASGIPRCRYLADSLRDALRLRPHIELSDSYISAIHWISLIQEWEDGQEDAEAYFYD